MKLTIIIPAFNEEAYLPSTLDSIKTAAAHLRSDSVAESDLIVVDNNSEDGTAAVAQSKGTTVVHEPVQGIARARNAGAVHADGDVLVFVDADVILPSTLLAEIHTAMSDPACVGGAVDVEYRPKRRFIRAYLGAWRLFSRLTGMAQGATQFCRKTVFDEIGGYDEQVWIGEDVDFFWALEKLASRTGRSTRFIESPRVQASSRRFDKWPIWKILLWTNPLFIALFRRRKAFWSGWYSRAVR